LDKFVVALKLDALFPDTLQLMTAYDRCPIWQALSPRLARLIGKVFPALKAN
jgi:hypothetical protein